MTAALNAQFSTVTVVPNFQNLSQMLSYDRLWLDQRWTSGSLTSTEISNIAAFIATGRRVVMVGENDYWTSWDNQILSIVGGSFGGEYTGSANTVLADPLTAGVSSVNLPTAGLVASGGTALFDHNWATLWGATGNTLTLLDVNVMSDTYWSSNNNGQFSENVAEWLAATGSDGAVPEPITILGVFSGVGALGAYLRRRFA
jgi:hypothetical protein